MKVFTHGFIDSIKPESGSNLTFFVNGEKIGQHYDMILCCYEAIPDVAEK